MPNPVTEGRHPGEFILNEANGDLSRDNITIAQNVSIVPGQVLGKITASSQFVPLNPAANDGSQNAAALPIYPANTGAGQTMQIAAITRAAEVNGNILTWPVGITAAQKAAAIAALGGAGVLIIVR
ncbi:head decoration protein [Bradyrhizobium sp. 2S1]|uniref:head decoration protein n=1 Tax=Bradyrhizobium sp. 2S1 TaxID=1404429 RepID=UPI00140C7DD2|nr:head decoration protein [Bradyrhizobium sp. 2S1]MCK7672390.1 head decoration protein [Bradyrhizobium sp. 2S1]